eukprot:TRINITY_DN12932_c0_g2_i1.p1 TRINITY_DN12932_c0_g2~~TRINITY_DN12932_c0_g2_i1.p1  ORF type:complete len:606 (+),score=64.62 TRINITY_DN12932_c0_g2_i1:1644-3461(+)
MSFSIVPVHLAVRAMRDNGYKNAAYAIAELMDNSIQAGAKNVELLCAETINQNSQRERRRVNKIGVLDDASGMDAETLRMALQFGNGTRLDPNLHTGIGRFGMGLPASSMSQCQRVEVWSWQDGVENAIYTYLDLEEIITERMSDVPEPGRRAIPEPWLSAGKSWGKSGTLVVWSSLDRLMWKTAQALIDNSEFVIGRMYRSFLKNGAVTIRLCAFTEDRPQNVNIERAARPNDPGYLMSGTSAPAPYDQIPLFEPWGGTNFEVVHQIEFRGKKHPVTISYSVAKETAREGYNPGSRDYGKHAARNTGLSIMRAGRELELDLGWADPSDPRDRWWGIEVEFPPALDEIFGVTNNKQHAHYFSAMATFDVDEMLQDGTTVAELKETLRAEEDPRAPLIEMAQQIQKTRNVLRRLLRAQTASEKGRRPGRHDVDRNSPESRATDVTNERKEQGHSGRSDPGEQEPSDQRQEEIEHELEDQGVPAAAAKELAAVTVSAGLKYAFAHADLETPAFFSVRQKGGSIIITLNTSHPAFSSLVEVLERDPDDTETDEDLKRRLDNALDGLKLLLMAWARYEDEQPDGPRRNAAQDTRIDWGRLARQFLQKEE